MISVFITYNFEEKSKKGMVLIPDILANALNWEDNDKLGCDIKTVDGETGLFLFKPK